RSRRVWRSDVCSSDRQALTDRAVREGLVTGEPRDFATTVLTLITPPGNPAGVTGLDDSLDGARLVVCADGVPCGNATRDLAAAEIGSASCRGQLRRSG